MVVVVVAAAAGVVVVELSSTKIPSHTHFDFQALNIVVTDPLILFDDDRDFLIIQENLLC